MQTVIPPAPLPPAATSPAPPPTVRDVLLIAAPIMLANATTPLIGFVDATVVGQLGAAHLIGGVAMASVMFNAIYWAFGFLRMSTTGFAAQALGAGNEREIAATLARAVVLAGVSGIVVVMLQVPLRQLFFWFLGGSPQVQLAAADYFNWRIWAAPAGLINFALVGWFIGLGRATTAFWLQLGLNVFNIALALLLTLHLDYGVPGVGAAACTAEWLAALAGLVVAARAVSGRGATITRTDILNPTKLAAMFAANRDILIRTVCVLGAGQVFMKMSASQGDVALAANALLLNILYIIYYLLDGYANAAETLVGQAIGARDRQRLEATVRISLLAAGVTAVVVSGLLWLFGAQVIAFMTSNPDVRSLASAFMPWAILMPIIAVWCFVYDGIFIGATRTVDMRNMMLISFVFYLVALAALVPWLGNHGVWAAHIVFFVVRALTLAWKYPGLAAEADRPH
jgi:multidrug resistance protein, MATE family